MSPASGSVVFMTESAEPDRPRLVLRRGALLDGYSDSEIRGLRRRGSWATLRRGGYLTPASAPLDGYERHRMLVDATLAGLRKPAVVSHISAAVLHGMALWAIHLGTMHVTRQPRANTGRSSSMWSHAAVLDEQDVVQLRGRLVTSAARTVVDVARMVPFEQAVVTADYALFRRLTTPAELADTVQRMAGIPGMRGARRAVAFANGLSESVGESRSRVLMKAVGLPAPDLQVEVPDDFDESLGRSDFGWVGGRVLGEFDGRMKFGRLLRPGESSGDAVFREKRREDSIRATGALVVRWTWSDLDAPTAMIARIRRAIGIAERPG